MNFKEAYEEMLKGQKVRRKNWEDYKYYTLNENDIYFIDKLIVSNITAKDALAEDWEVLEENKESKIWKLKEREPYYYVNSNGEVLEDCNSNHRVDKDRICLGNCFKTKEEAKYMVEKLKVINELKNFALENNAEEIDWKNLKQVKWAIAYSRMYKNLELNDWRNTQFSSSNIYFTSREIAQKAIETIGADRIKKYYFDVED